MNFNAKHGCMKCTVVGEYSHVSHTVTFQSVNCPKRNNADFREKKYEKHQKIDSPLLELNVDMIEDFPVSDSLHLIDLGVMKRLLTGWRDGNFGKYVTKWSHRDIEKVNSFLSNCHLPKEIHRAVRQLDVLAYWKGSEYRSFLYYLSPVLLKYLLNPEAFHHYLCFYCAIMICSNQHFFRFLPLAEELLKYFVTHFHVFYGKDYITSNMHNLCHVVDEVRRFGILQTFNAYPFENKLQLIKSLLRQGNKPLEQVAKRLLERNFVEIETFNEQKPKWQFVKESMCKNGKHNMILHLETFIISPEEYITNGF